MNPENSRVTEVRLHFGLTKAEFARRVKLDASTINKAESGPTRPGLDTLNAIADAFADISTEWLFRGKGPMIAPKLSADVEQIADQLNLLTMKYQMQAGKLEAQARELADKDKLIRHLEDNLGKSGGNADQPVPFSPRPTPSGPRASVRTAQRQEIGFVITAGKRSHDFAK